MKVQGCKWLLLILWLSLAACNPLPVTPALQHPEAQAPTFTPFQPVPWTVTPEEFSLEASPPPNALTPDTPTPNAITPVPLPATPSTFSIYIDPNLPRSFRQRLGIPADLPLVEQADSASLHLRVGADYPVSQWVYALVAPFPTVTDGVSA